MDELALKEIMTTDLVTIHIDKNLSYVAEIFKTKALHHIPVVDDEGSLTGIISLTDFERITVGASLFRNPEKEAYNEALLKSMLVSQIMTKDVVKLHPTDSIRAAYKIFKENKFRAIPIVGKGQLMGIVTPIDILDYFFK
ncbi:MAG: CBS domain-containing protein [Saprospiraceae bacterium]|jgi:CBS domain-containing protein